MIVRESPSICAVREKLQIKAIEKKNKCVRFISELLFANLTLNIVLTRFVSRKN